MGSFTSPTSWTYGGQDNEAANEIVTSYFEHRLVLGQAPSAFALIEKGENAQRVYNNPSWGGDGQGKNVFQEIQEWLEQYCGSFLDTTSAASFLTEDRSEFKYFTKAAWQAAAGLNVSDDPCGSFRRKANMADMWSYGTFLPGDIRGPWCFEDLQNGLNALKWTKQGGTYVWPTGDHKYIEQYGIPDDALADSVAGRIADFNAQSWDALPKWSPGIYRINATVKRGWLGMWEIKIERFRLRQTLNFPAVPRKIDIYIKVADNDAFCDFDGVGFVPDQYYLYRAEPETSALQVVLDPISNISDSPLSGYPGSAYIEQSGLIYYVEKWKFTYGED